jgi:uncharacterized protein (TIGR02145 family)
LGVCLEKQQIMEMKRNSTCSVLLLLLAIIMFFTGGCRKEKELPEVLTIEISEINQAIAVGGGNVISYGGSTLLVRGVVWSENPEPTFYSYSGYTTDGIGLGEFNSTLTRLRPSTTYFMRAYARNSKGIGYGNTVEFTTLDIISGDGVTDTDGNFYPTVIIGEQEWMAENLRTTVYSDETVIPYVSGDVEWWNTNEGAYCWFNNDTDLKYAYGALYNGYAVATEKLCPAGWRVPSDAEWAQLVDYLFDEIGVLKDYSENGPGNVLKSCRQLNSPLANECNTEVHPRWEQHTLHYGTDNFGFSALPGGYRMSYGSFHRVGEIARFWSSTEYSLGSFLWYWTMSHENGGFGNIFALKDVGFSVRCVRDMENPR